MRQRTREPERETREEIFVSRSKWSSVARVSRPFISTLLFLSLSPSVFLSTLPSPLPAGRLPRKGFAKVSSYTFMTQCLPRLIPRTGLSPVTPDSCVLINPERREQTNERERERESRESYNIPVALISSDYTSDTGRPLSVSTAERLRRVA